MPIISLFNTGLGTSPFIVPAKALAFLCWVLEGLTIAGVGFGSGACQENDTGPYF